MSNNETLFTVSGQQVRVHVGRDGDGTEYLGVEGVGCELEGEQPGIYYVRAALRSKPPSEAE